MSLVERLGDSLLARLVPEQAVQACAIATKVSGGVAAENCRSKLGRYECMCFHWPNHCTGGWRFYACYP